MRFEAGQYARAAVVISDGQHHHHQLSVHPAIAGAAPNAVDKPQPQAQSQRRERQNRGEAQQLFRHQQQALALGHAAFRDHGQIHKNPRQVKKTREPAGNEDDVEGFDPEHGLECSAGSAPKNGEKRQKNARLDTKSTGRLKPFCVATQGSR